MSIAPAPDMAPDSRMHQWARRSSGHASPGPSPTTFLELTRLAALAIDAAEGDLRAGVPGRDGDACVEDAYRDLMDALWQLGVTVLGAPRLPAAPPVRGRKGPGRGSDARVLLVLRRLAKSWQDDQDLQPEDPCAAVLRAAALIRAAADLWSTHRTSEGAPRTPEGARLRAPGMLGAARSQWRALVHEAASLAGPISSSEVLGPVVVTASRDLVSATSRSTPGSVRTGDTGALGLARPGVRAASAEAQLHDRVSRLELIAWTGWQRQDTPAVVHQGIARCGWTVARAAAELAARPCCGSPVTAARLRHATHRVEAAEAWRDLATAVRDLRTLHGPMVALAHEAATVAVLTQQLAGDGSPRRPPGPRRGHGHQPGCPTSQVRGLLEHAGAGLLRAADWNRRSLGVAGVRGDLLIRGKALPASMLRRRPDLVRASVTGTVAPLPAAMARSLDGAYRRVLSTSGSLQATAGVSQKAVA